MKIGILTFHYGSNYGGVLQAYASQMILKQLGHDAQIINYRPKDSIKQFVIILLECVKKRNYKGLKEFAFYIKHLIGSKKVFKRFCNEYLNQTKRCSREQDLQELQYDYLYVGSDQVWNISQQKYNTYFLGWCKDASVKKISYAACCGRNRIDVDMKDKLIQQLSDFDSISVRSVETQLFIKELLGKSVPVVADPTFLYDFSEFVTPIKDKYILTYILGPDIKGSNKRAIDIIKLYYPNIPVYSIIIGDHTPRLCSWTDKQLIDISPSDWVNLFANSEFVYTDSFHGSVFALKFNKPFIAYYTGDIAGRRFVDLANIFNLKNIVTDVSQIESILKTGLEFERDYSLLIDDVKDRSFSYIKQALKNNL